MQVVFSTGRIIYSNLWWRTNKRNQTLISKSILHVFLFRCSFRLLKRTNINSSNLLGILNFSYVTKWQMSQIREMSHILEICETNVSHLPEVSPNTAQCSHRLHHANMGQEASPNKSVWTWDKSLSLSIFRACVYTFWVNKSFHLDFLLFWLFLECMGFGQVQTRFGQVIVEITCPKGKWVFSISSNTDPDTTYLTYLTLEIKTHTCNPKSKQFIRDYQCILPYSCKHWIWISSFSSIVPTTMVFVSDLLTLGDLENEVTMAQNLIISSDFLSRYPHQVSSNLDESLWLSSVQKVWETTDDLYDLSDLQ